MDLKISYTDFGKVNRIEEGNKDYEVTYSVNDSRIKSFYKDNSETSTRYYIGDYEELTDNIGNVTKYHYLCGGAVMVESDGKWELCYNYTDRLGSVVTTVDAAGNVLERYAYDPWGNRLNPDNWKERDSRTELLNNRGFSGHEHLDQFGLINMNGRVYDPMLSTFLSVDPLLQAPDNWLNYNRYLYCYGNPLSYVDPSGYESTPLWNNQDYYEVSPNYSPYDFPGKMNWNTDTYKNTPSWWNNNTNTNYYGPNTGPGFITVLPPTNHGQNTTSYNNGNLVYRKNQQSQAKSVTVIPSISKINTQINNPTSPIIKTYTSGIIPRTWEDELGDWMRNTFSSHSEIKEAQNLEPIAESLVVFTGAGIINDIKILTLNRSLFDKNVTVYDKGLSAVSLVSFGTMGILTTIKKAPIVAGVANGINIITSFISIVKSLYEEHIK